MDRDKLQELYGIIRNSKRIVFFGGAGVSTASGIPDFRSGTGLFSTAAEDTLSPEMILTKTFFYLHPEQFFSYYRKYMLHPNAKPNIVHQYLYRLEQRDQLRGIVTQNTDGLHRKAGNIRVYELHGNVHENYCMECNAFYPAERVLSSGGIPRCDCGGVIKPNIVLYGEPLEKYVCIGARREITNADTLIIAGTSLMVEPAASFIGDFRGKHLIVMNKAPVPADQEAELCFRDNMEDIFRAITTLDTEKT